jgi:hypothetical protein
VLLDLLLEDSGLVGEEEADPLVDQAMELVAGLVVHILEVEMVMVQQLVALVEPTLVVEQEVEVEVVQLVSLEVMVDLAL